ncbi:MAG: hypothetical protein LBN74_02970 [Prevotella sp.]|nr:hypothetical protein [Prevotella sp.]
MKFLTYIFISAISLAFLMLSCDGDESLSSRSVEGHWLYMDTKIEVSVSDPILKKRVDEYIRKNIKSPRASYEFKNDRTYYYYLDNEDPLKGKFKMLDKNYATLDDSRGLRKLITEDSLIYVLHDLKSEIARDLNINEDKIIEATLTEIYERGLQPAY